LGKEKKKSGKLEEFHLSFFFFREPPEKEKKGSPNTPFQETEFLLINEAHQSN
jgi:hypothetical protein